MRAFVSVQRGGRQTGAESIFTIGDSEKTLGGLTARLCGVLQLPSDTRFALYEQGRAEPLASTADWTAACERAVQQAGPSGASSAVVVLVLDTDPLQRQQAAVAEAQEPPPPAAAAEAEAEVEVEGTAKPAQEEPASTGDVPPPRPTSKKPPLSSMPGTDLQSAASAAVVNRSDNRVVQNSITEIAAEPGPLVFKVAKSAVKSILPGAAKLALKGAKIAIAAGSFLLNQSNKFDVVRNALVNLNYVPKSGQSEHVVLNGDPFKFVEGTEALLRAADTEKLGIYHITYDEVSKCLMYVFRVDSSAGRQCKRNERGSWLPGCPTRADLERAEGCPRVAQRAYFYHPRDEISVEFAQLTTATTTAAAKGARQLLAATEKAAGRKAAKERRRPRRFAVKKTVYWLCDAPRCDVRVAVLSVDKALLDARQEMAMQQVLAKMHDMGFTDDARNRQALAKHNGDLRAAIQDLI